MDDPAMMDHSTLPQKEPTEEADNLIELPEGVMADAEDGDDFEGLLTGKVVVKDDKRFVQPEQIEGEPIPQDAEEGRTDDDVEDEITQTLKKQPGIY